MPVVNKLNGKKNLMFRIYRPRPSMEQHMLMPTGRAKLRILKEKKSCMDAIEIAAIQPRKAHPASSAGRSASGSERRSPASIYKAVNKV
ncbi:hypothetical protein HMSSN036_38270 [Paenibacillus macerans]|nr:hypothetical protein HMSSN036_38270 [Paenibacillus macerans]